VASYGKDNVVLIKQAIYTSVRSGRNDGYQLAATSPGISADDARELSQWGPAHDSIYPERSASGCVNFHLLSSGLFAVSRTVSAGREYSGRGGERIYTHNFLVPPAALAQFANNPFRIMDALVASGRASVMKSIPKQLQPVPLVGRASAVNTINLEKLRRAVGADKLAALLNAALTSSDLGVVTDVSPDRLFAGLLDLLPPPYRPEFCLTTGLKASPRRPFRLMVLPDDAEEQRRAIRQVGLTALDLTNEPPAKFAPDRGWPLLMHGLLQANQFATIASVADTLAGTGEKNLDALAEQIQQDLDEGELLADILTPFSA
jgi:hypothetical protein